MFRPLRISALLSALVVLSACTDRAPAPTGPTISASHTSPPSTAALASPAWQVAAANNVPRASFNPLAASRAYALVGVAQYLAVQRAAAGADGTDGEDGEVEHESEGGDRHGHGWNRVERDRGAVAGASAVVLTYLFPTQAQAFEDLVVAQGVALSGRRHTAFTRAEAIGRAVGAEIVARAQGDGFNKPFTGTIPTGPGLWISPTTPATVFGGQLATASPWFLTSPSQFRPAAPPAFGSTAFTAALAEIRQLSDTRTADQTRIAAFWAFGAGTPTPTGFWMQVATDGINQRGLSERRATHLYALLGATMYDALIGCWDAKQTYWYIRPWQADAAITTVAAVGKPPHPSYPSGHSCASASGAEVLSTFFPEQRAQLDAMVTEAGLSRMYGGIHYRFDIEAGQALGRNVARFAIAADASENSLLSPDITDDADDEVDDDRETPIVARANFNVTLRGVGPAHGHIKFRQPADADLIVYLDTRVRGLAPNTNYLLQRAADGPADGKCTSTSWLTLGKGTQAQAITTDPGGTGREVLYRTLSSPVGSTFDIRFRVINAATSMVVLQSRCYQFVVTR